MIACAVMLVDLDVEGVVAAVRRFDGLRRSISKPAISHSFARNLSNVFHHALCDVVDVGRKGVRRPLEYPEAAAGSEAYAFHIEVEIADDDLLLLGMRIEPRIRAADL